MDPSWKQSVALDFWTNFNISDEHTARLFIDCMLDYGFVPDKYGDDDPPSRRFNAESIDGFVKLWIGRPNQMSIQRLGRLGFQAILHLNPHLGEGLQLLSVGVHDDYFRVPGNSEKFLELGKKLYSIVKPVHGDVGHMNDRRDKTVIARPVRVGIREVLAEEHLPAHPTTGLFGVYWANCFGPVYVTFFSEAKLRSAPAYKTETLPDGGYLILTSKSPLDYQSPEVKSMEKALMNHLGENAFFDKRKPDKVMKTPFGQGTSHSSDGKTRPKTLPGLLQCPECSESEKITKATEDPANNLTGFRCLKCGAVWAVEKSLIH